MLPNGWSTEKLGTLFDFKNGVNTEAANYGSGLKFVNVMDVFNNKYLTCEKIREKVNVPKKKSDIYLLEYGDILFNRTSETYDEIGLSTVYLDTAPAIFGGFVIRARPTTKKLDPEFCVYSFTSRNVRKEIIRRGQGAIRTNIGQGDMRHVPLTIPPLPEQKKIAKILSTWDKAITTTEQLIANSQQQKNALMQQLLTGKKRLAGYLSDNFSVRKGFSISKLGGLPNDWKVEIISKYFWFQEGPGVRKHQFTEDGVKLFNGTNIQHGLVNLSNTKTHISKDEANGAYKHFLADSGDLVIACSGISVDRFDEKIAFLSESHLPLCMNTSTMRFKCLDDNLASIDYFRYFMMSPLFKNQIRRQITGSAQLNFGPSHVGKCFVVLPSAKEQQKIAQVLSSADQEVETLQQKLSFLKEEKKALMQQLLKGKRRVKLTKQEAENV